MEKKSNQQLTQDELDFVSDSKAAALGASPRFAWISLYLMLLAIVIGLLWVNYAIIDEMTVGEGKIVPSSQLKIIQNLEGGIIHKLPVKEGELVEKGEVLVTLDNTRFEAAYKEDLAKYNVLQAKVARLTAEAEGGDKIKFSDGFVSSYPDLAKHAMKLFRNNKKAVDADLQVLKKTYQLTQHELRIVKPLVKQGVMSQLESIRLERQLNVIHGQLLTKQNSIKVEAQEKLNKTKATLSALSESLRATLDRFLRTVIRSPVRGTVNKIYVTTQGEVIRPGVKIMNIVPFDRNLTIVVKISPTDIGFIHLGQEAKINVSAYDSSIYGSLDAKVINISADTMSDDTGSTFYEVKLKTHKNHLGTKQQKLSIMPGMTVTANILTGKRSVLDYILKPFYKTKQKALRER